MIPQFQAAMFDMDGTLLCSMRYWRMATIELLLSYNIFPTPEQMSRVFRMSSRALCMEAFAEHGIIKDQWEVLHELEGFMLRHYREDVHAKPNAEAYLQKLRSEGVPMCVATASPKAYACEALERQGLLHYFDFVTDCAEQQMRKDDPVFFERIARRMNVAPEQMCVFEDTLYAVRGAKTAHCPVVAIRDDAQMHEWAQTAQLADHCIADYCELL